MRTNMKWHNGSMRALRSMRILGKHWKLTIIAEISLSIAMALGIISISVSNQRYVAASGGGGSGTPRDDLLAFAE